MPDRKVGRRESVVYRAKLRSIHSSERHSSRRSSSSYPRSSCRGADRNIDHTCHARSNHTAKGPPCLGKSWCDAPGVQAHQGPLLGKSKDSFRSTFTDRRQTRTGHGHLRGVHRWRKSHGFRPFSSGLRPGSAGAASVPIAIDRIRAGCARTARHGDGGRRHRQFGNVVQEISRRSRSR